MAKKKLNKKVAIVGTILLGAVVLAAIFVVLKKCQGPEKFIKDAQAQYAAKDYEGAAKSYRSAYGAAKTNPVRKELLFRLADTYQLQNDWQKTMDCWRRIMTMDSSDIPSRVSMLNFFYEMADTGQVSAWKRVQQMSEELLELDKKPRYYFIKGRATVELAKRGEMSDREKGITDAIAALQKAKELNPKDAEVYWYLAQAAILKGDIAADRGMTNEKDKAYVQAQSLLKQAIKASPADANSYINLLGVQLKAAVEKSKSVKSLEDDFVAITKKFPSNAAAYSALSGYYKLDPNNADKALLMAQKANELDKQNVSYAIGTAELCYLKGSMSGNAKLKQKALEIAKYALTMPSAQPTQGPREWINKMNKLSLCTFIANTQISALMDMGPQTPKEQRDAASADAEQAVHEVTQIWGSGAHPYVVQLEGMLAYAKGDKQESIKKMFTAYEQLKQSDSKNQDTQLGELSYTLAKAFSNSPEIGARREFLFNAIQRGKFRTKPDILLDYAKIAIDLRDYSGCLSAASMYEKLVKATTATTLLKAQANMGAGQIDEAEALLATLSDKDAEVLATKFAVLQSRSDRATATALEKSNDDSTAGTDQIKKLTDEQAAIAYKLLKADPNANGVIASVAEKLISQKRYDDARTYIKTVMGIRANEPTALFYAQLLAEKDPGTITPQRRADISAHVAGMIKDPVKKAFTMADIYRSKGELEKAMAEYKKVLEADASNKSAVAMLFDTALGLEDYKTAERMAALAKKDNLDNCEGQIFSARLSLAKKEYKAAIAKLEEAIKDRPVSAAAYSLRSSANAAMGNDLDAIADARKAAIYNPIEGSIAKQLANLLYQRNAKLGKAVSDEQRTETREALERAYAMNPREWQLLSFYAEFISDAEPVRALSIRQRLQKLVPTVQNATLLGNMALRMSMETKDSESKRGFLELAGDAYAQGMKIDPKNNELLFNYARYLTTTEQGNKATSMLASATDKNLLWQYYLSTGQLAKAKESLEVSYKVDPKNIAVLKGLLMVCEGMGDADGVVKYSQELLALENTEDNQIAQIRALLETGLIPQAQKQLAALREKYPNNTKGLLLQAYMHTRKGEFSDAGTYVDKCLTINPNEANAWSLKGQIAFSQGKYNDAVTAFQKSKSISTSTKVRMDLARAYLRAKRGDDAINELVATIQENENSFEARQMLEAIYMQLNRKDALNNFYAATIKKFPEAIFWYNQAGSSAMYQKEYTKAAALYKGGWQVAQSTDAAKSGKAGLKQAMVALDGYLNALLQSKQYDQLVPFSAQYIDSVYAPIALARMADAKAGQSDKKSAIDLYHKALDKAQSDDSVLLEILGRMAVAVGREETTRWCSEELKTSPDSFTLNLAMANLFRLNAEYNKALTYIDKCLKITDIKAPAYNSLVDSKQAILVQAFEKTNNKDYLKQAISIYEKIISDTSDSAAGSMNNLAYLLAKYPGSDSDLDKALKYAQRAYETVPGNPNIMDTYAFVLYKKGQYAKAVELATVCVQMFEQTSVSAPADAYAHIGMIKEKLNRKAEAIAAYKQALELGNDTLTDADKVMIKSALEKLK